MLVETIKCAVVPLSIAKSEGQQRQMKRAIKILKDELLQWQLNLDTHKALLKHGKFNKEKYRKEITEDKKIIAELKQAIRILKQTKNQKKT